MSSRKTVEIPDEIMKLAHEIIDSNPHLKDSPELWVAKGLMIDSRPTHRHKKRGSEYVLIGFGKMQSESWLKSAKLSRDNLPENVGLKWVERDFADNAEVAIYRSVADGSLWVRPREEFEDGRFEQL